jgi:hypothetical protein
MMGALVAVGASRLGGVQKTINGNLADFPPDFHNYIKKTTTPESSEVVEFTSISLICQHIYDIL